MIDVVVVGAGLAGASVAWAFSQRGLSVLVIDVSAPGSEASAQNAGMQRRFVEGEVEQQLAIWAGAWLEGHQERLPAGTLQKTGGVLVTDSASATRSADRLREAGVCCLKVGDVRSLCPIVGGPVSGYHMPDDHLVDAHSLLTTWLSWVVESGGRVIREEVTGLVFCDNQVTVRLKRGEVNSRRVCIAAGAWSSQIGEMAGIKRSLYPMRRHVFRTGASVYSRSHPWVWLDDVGIYARPEGAQFLLSPCDERFDVPAGFGSTGAPDLHWLAWMDHLMNTHFSEISAELVGGWTGLRTFAADRLPFLGPDPEQPRLLWCAGLGGFGVTCAVAAGEQVARLVLEDDVPIVEPQSCCPGRFSETPAWASEAKKPWENLEF